MSRLLIRPRKRHNSQLRRIRLERGISGYALAKATGLAQTRISRLELWGTPFRDHSIYDRLAAVLDCDPKELVP